jgi:hypothetical protein
MNEWSVDNKIVTNAMKAGPGKLQVITDSLSIKIFVISEDIMQPLLGCNAECKKAKQQAAYNISYGLVFIH